VATVIYKYIKI